MHETRNTLDTADRAQENGVFLKKTRAHKKERRKRSEKEKARPPPLERGKENLYSHTWEQGRPRGKGREEQIQSQSYVR